MFEVRPYPARTISWWVQQKDKIDIAPVYQRRGKIWTAEDKASLVDSIINDFDMPKIYVADFTYANSPLNKQRKQYAVIDGKQRFEAIFDFFENKLPLSKAVTSVDFPEANLEGLTYKDLNEAYPQIAKKFDNFNLSVMSVITNEEEKINDLFVRLNRSKPLTGAEIRNAIKGKIPELIRSIAQHLFFQTCVAFQTKRAQDLNAAGKLLLIEFRGGFVDTKRTHLDRFVEEGEKAQSTYLDGCLISIQNNLNRMRQIFIEKDPLLRSQGPTPLYYWFIRENGEKHGKKIRQFLVEFNLARQRNRVDAREGKSSEAELSLFDNLDRSTNDQNSLVGRYKILQKRFRKFLESSTLL